jgi:hypothetical protein
VDGWSSAGGKKRSGVSIPPPKGFPFPDRISPLFFTGPSPPPLLLPPTSISHPTFPHTPHSTGSSLPQQVRALEGARAVTVLYQGLAAALRADRAAAAPEEGRLLLKAAVAGIVADLCASSPERRKVRASIETAVSSFSECTE